MLWLYELTPGDWMLFLGLLTNAAVTLYVIKVLTHVRVDVKAIAVATNGLQKVLVASSIAEGEVKGRADEKLDEAKRQALREASIKIDPVKE